MAKAKSNSVTRGQGLSHPYHNLESVLKLGAVVFENGGRDVPKSVIADALKMTESTASFLCTSAKSFGVVEGNRDLTLTELGRDYFYPTSPNATKQAILGFVASPPLFKALIDRFDGNRLPSGDHLPNLAKRQFGVAQSWSQRAVGIFTGALNLSGVIDPTGFLRYGAAVHQASAQSGRDESLSRMAEQLNTALRPKSLSDSQSNTAQSTATSGIHREVVGGENNVWSFSEAGGAVRLETSKPLPRALWDRLTKYVKMLEPSEPNGGEP